MGVAGWHLIGRQGGWRQRVNGLKYMAAFGLVVRQEIFVCSLNLREYIQVYV